MCRTLGEQYTSLMYKLRDPKNSSIGSANVCMREGGSTSYGGVAPLVAPMAKSSHPNFKIDETLKLAIKIDHSLTSPVE